MVLNHVAKGTGGVVISAAAAFHAEVFRTGDLDVADVFAVPEWFKNRVGEAQDHEILGGFLTEVMVDPVGILLLKGGVDHFVEMAGGGEIGAEGFFHDDARPAAVGRLIETGVLEVDQDVIKEIRSGGDVEQAVALAPARGVDLVERFGKAAVAIGIGELCLMVVHVFDEGIPHGFIMAGAGDLAVDLFQSLAEFRVGFFAAGEADDFHTGR